MAGFAILKHMHDLSDEVLCERWLENPYFQRLCGEEFFQHQLPFDRSSMTRWRQRMGEERLNALLAGEPFDRDPHGCGQARRLHQGDRRHDRAGEGDGPSDRCQADAPGA